MIVRKQHLVNLKFKKCFKIIGDYFKEYIFSAGASNLLLSAYTFLFVFFISSKY